MRERWDWRWLTASVVGALMLGAVATAPAASAQDETTGGDEARPAHIHSGTCDTLGEVVAPLTDLTGPGGAAATTDETGGTDATPSTDDSGATDVGTTDDGETSAQYSYTLVPLSLDAILSAEHAINVHESGTNIDNYIACGDVSGTVDANGTLVIGLRELNDSGYVGVAVLTQNAADANATDVSVFIVEGLLEDDFGGAAGDDDTTGTGGATDDGTTDSDDDSDDDLVATPTT